MVRTYLNNDPARDVIVRPGRCRIEAGRNTRLVAFGVGSCIALAVHAPERGVRALLRITAPASAADPVLAQKRPWLFADTAVPALLARLKRRGVRVRELSVYAAGGAAGEFATSGHASGLANSLALKKALWQQGVLLAGGDFGGVLVRSMYFDGEGRILVSSEPGIAGRVTKGAGLWRTAC